MGTYIVSKSVELDYSILQNGRRFNIIKLTFEHGVHASTNIIPAIVLCSNIPCISLHYIKLLLLFVCLFIYHAHSHTKCHDIPLTVKVSISDAVVLRSVTAASLGDHGVATITWLVTSLSSSPSNSSGFTRSRTHNHKTLLELGFNDDHCNIKNI